MNDFFNYKKDEGEERDIPSFKVTFDLKGFPYANEMIAEDKTGKKVEGIFIPYDRSFVYRHEKHAFVNIFAVHGKPRRGSSLYSYNYAKRSHFLIPYLTQAQRQELIDARLSSKYIDLGWMEILEASNKKAFRKSGGSL